MPSRRGAGEGTVTQRSDGRWMARLRYVDPITELAERATFYGATRREAQDKLDDAKLRLRQRQNPRDAGIRLADFLKLWLEDVVRPSKRPETYRSYKTTIEQHLAPSRLGGMQLRDLREVQIQHVFVAKAKGATRSQELALIVLRRALSQAVKWNMLAINPANDIEAPRRTIEEMRVLTLEQTRTFLDAAAGDRLFALYFLALDTGMRQGELLALRWADVDFDRGKLRVVRQRNNHSGAMVPVKTAKSRRSIDLSAETLDVLREHRKALKREGLDVELVFPNVDGGALSPQNVRNRSYLPLQKAAGIVPPIRFHDLRHTAATLMLAEGMSIKAVSERLGHANPAITMNIYQHVTETMHRETADTMGRLLSARPLAKKLVGVKVGVNRAPQATGREKKKAP